MKVGIIGSRDYPDLEAVWDYVASLPPDTIIISGGAQGVDKAAEDAAEYYGLAKTIHHAKWNELGKTAGLIRNRHLIRDADRVVAFHWRNSRGTAHAISIAKHLEKPCLVIKPDVQKLGLMYVGAP